MTFEITKIENEQAQNIVPQQKIDIDFSDEGVDLQAGTKVIGDKSAAKKYVPTFASDIRRQNRHLFPLPEVPEPEEFVEE